MRPFTPHWTEDRGWCASPAEDGLGQGRHGVRMREEARCKTIPFNTEGKRSELKERVRVKGQYREALGEISNSNTWNIKTTGIEGTQF
jgi:hypothetical protein